jgi:hypothetical protein
VRSDRRGTAADKLQEMLRETAEREGKFITSASARYEIYRYCSEKFLTFLDTSRKIGLTVTESFLMVPSNLSA